MSDTPPPSTSVTTTTPTPVEEQEKEDVPVGVVADTKSEEEKEESSKLLSDDVLGGVGLMELTSPLKSEGDSSEEEDPTASIISLLNSLSPGPPALGQDFDDEVPKLSKALEKHCYDYSEYLSYPNLILQQVKEADAAAETMLNRLDEVGALTDTVRTESANIRRQILALLNDCQHLPVVFGLIDKLLVLTAKMHMTLDKLEERVVEAEDENSYSLGSFLTYMGAKRSASETYRKPPIPNTKEYFDKVRTDMIAATEEQMSSSSSSGR